MATLYYSVVLVFNFKSGVVNYTINQAVQSGKPSSSFNFMEICIETFSVFCLLESARTGFFSWLSKVGKKTKKH